MYSEEEDEEEKKSGQKKMNGIEDDHKSGKKADGTDDEDFSDDDDDDDDDDYEKTMLEAYGTVIDENDDIDEFIIFRDTLQGLETNIGNRVFLIIYL